MVSKLDIAGMNMLKYLLRNNVHEVLEIIVPDTWPEGDYTHYKTSKFSILLIPGDQILTDYLAGSLEADLLIYASKHSAASGKKALLIHTTGIFTSDTSHGGLQYTLNYSPYNLISKAYEKISEIQEHNELDYWTGIEVTHHGPTLDIPVIFMETGGTEEEWNDIRACELIAEVIMYVIDLVMADIHLQSFRPTAIGIGGTHYGASFIKQLDKKAYYLGHILPKYAHDSTPDTIIDEMWNKTLGENKIFLIDKKGCNGRNRRRFIDLIESRGYKWEYT